MGVPGRQGETHSEPEHRYSDLGTTARDKSVCGVDVGYGHWLRGEELLNASAAVRITGVRIFSPVHCVFGAGIAYMVSGLHHQ